MVEGRSSSGTGGDPWEKSGIRRANVSSTGERFTEFDKGEIPVQRLLVRGAGAYTTSSEGRNPPEEGVFPWTRRAMQRAREQNTVNGVIQGERTNVQPMSLGRCSSEDGPGGQYTCGAVALLGGGRTIREHRAVHIDAPFHRR